MEPFTTTVKATEKMSTAFVIHGVKPGWDIKQTLAFIKSVISDPKWPTEGCCPRCHTRLCMFSCAEVSLCLICHIRFTWEKNPRILPPTAICHDAKHDSHRMNVHYTDTSGRDNYLLECTSCWRDTLKAMDRPKVGTEAELEVAKKSVARLMEEMRGLRLHWDALLEDVAMYTSLPFKPDLLAMEYPTKPADDKKQP